MGYQAYLDGDKFVHLVDDDEGLAIALKFAESNQRNDEIRLAGSTFTEDHLFEVWTEENYDLIILGGYSEDYLARDTALFSTIFDGGSITLGSASRETDIDFLLDGITFTNKLVSGFDLCGAALAISTTNGNITVSQSVFANNLIDGTGGGALHIQSNSSANEQNVFVSNNLFTNNGQVRSFNTGAFGDGGGAAFILGSSQVVVAQNEFSNNYAGGDGGALNVHSSAHIELSQNIFSDNTAATGGAVYARANRGEVVLYDNQFSSNEADFFGGAARVVLLDSSVEAKGNEFTDNTAADRGGAIDIAGSSGYYTNVITDSVFQGNYAEEQGGAIYLNAGSNNQVSLVNNLIVQNATGIGPNELYGGGGVYIRTPNGAHGRDPDVTLIGNTIAHNATGAQGGGVFVRLTHDYTDFLIANNLFAGNTESAGRVSDLKINGREDYTTFVLDGNVFSEASSAFVHVDSPSPLETASGTNYQVNAAFEGDSYLPTAGQVFVDGGTNQFVTSLTDVDGGIRIIGDAVDPGAIELQNSPYVLSITRPLEINPNPNSMGLLVSFSERIFPGDNQSKIKLIDSNGDVAWTAGPTDDQITWSDSSITIEVGDNLPFNETYTLIVESGFSTDIEGASSQEFFSSNSLSTEAFSPDPDIPDLISLGVLGGRELNLIHPIQFENGKIYYLLDANGDGLNSRSEGNTYTYYLDAVDHNFLDEILNNGNDTTDTQPNGAVYGVDDARTVTVGPVTAALPTVDEFSASFFQGNTFWSDGNQYTLNTTDLVSAGWNVANMFWLATDITSNSHYWGNAYTGVTRGDASSNYDGSSMHFAFFEVVFNSPPVIAEQLSDVAIFEDNYFSWRVPVNAFQDSDAGDILSYSFEASDGLPLPGWLAVDGHALSGVPGNLDPGSYEIRVTATDLAGAQVSGVFTLSVANTNDPPVGTLTITGDNHVGGLLTTVVNFDDPDGIAEGAITYQWRRGLDVNSDGEISGDEGWVDIPGATGSTYRLSVEDAGQHVSVLASYTDEQGTQESVSSNAALGGWPAPEIIFTQSPDAPYSFVAGSSGAALTFYYEIRADGAGISVVDRASPGWAGFEATESNSPAFGFGDLTLSAYTVGDPLLGVEELVSFVVQPYQDARDVSVFINYAEATFVGDEDPTLLESDISYTIKVGADVTVTHAMPINETTGQVEMSEGDGSQGTWFTWNVELDRAVDVDHEIDWSVSGAGEFGVSAEDFAGGVLPSGTLQIAAGERTGTISFQVAGDGLVERDEGFEVTLSGTNGLNLSGVSTLGGMLLNDDKAKASIVAEAVTGAEGGAGETSTYTFEVELDQAVYAEQVVQWQLVDLVEDIRGLASQDDFAGALSGEVVFAAGETTQTVTIEIAGDLEKEGRESFGIELFDPSALLEVPTEATTVQIKDDDGYDLGGQVYFWGKGDPAKQWLMDGVEVGFASSSATYEEAINDAISSRNWGYNAQSGTYTVDLWADQIGYASAISFELADDPGISFQSALGEGWNVVTDSTGGAYNFSAIWTGEQNTQTSHDVFIGTFSMTLPEGGAGVTSHWLAGSISNDAGEQFENSWQYAFQFTNEGQTQVLETPSPDNGTYFIPSQVEGVHQVLLDKAVELRAESGDWSKEVRALTAADARETLLISLGKEVSGEALIAADVNKSGTVTAADARDILLMSVKDQTRLEDKLDWVFVSEDADLSGLTRRDVREGEDWVQGRTLYLQDDQTSENLVAILMGDVNASYTPLIQHLVA